MEYTVPEFKPVPIAGFWLIKREEDDVIKYYTFESLEPTLDIQEYVVDCEHVQFFCCKDDAEGRLAELSDYEIEEIQ